MVRQRSEQNGRQVDTTLHVTSVAAQIRKEHWIWPTDWIDLNGKSSIPRVRATPAMRAAVV
jgi:hypothetical protein